MNQYPLTFGRAVDGDTIVVDVDLGFGVLLRSERLRLYGVNCPELRDPLGPAAKSEIETIVRVAGSLLLVPAAHRRDKYGRLLGSVLADGIDVAAAMVQRGFATPVEARVMQALFDE